MNDAFKSAAEIEANTPITGGSASLSNADLLAGQIDRCGQLTKIDMKHKIYFELLASAAAELGEVAEELLIENNSFGSRHKKSDEGSKVESVDLVICGLSLYFAKGGTLEELPEILSRKLSKWEKGQCVSGSGGQ